MSNIFYILSRMWQDKDHKRLGTERGLQRCRKYKICFYKTLWKIIIHFIMQCAFAIELYAHTQHARVHTNTHTFTCRKSSKGRVMRLCKSILVSTFEYYIIFIKSSSHTLIILPLSSLLPPYLPNGKIHFLTLSSLLLFSPIYLRVLDKIGLNSIHSPFITQKLHLAWDEDDSLSRIDVSSWIGRIHYFAYP